MLKLIAIITCLCAVSSALSIRKAGLGPGPVPRDDCPFPDGTDTALYWASCNTNDVIQPNSITVTDDAGNTNYPVDVTVPVVVKANSVNNGVVYQKNLVDVDLYSWGGWLGCNWHSMPTFGLLNNLDGCSIGQNCPIQTGDLLLQVSVDLSKFSTIIQALASDKPYRIDIHIKNADDSQHEEICCIRVEALLQK